MSVAVVLAAPVHALVETLFGFGQLAILYFAAIEGAIFLLRHKRRVRLPLHLLLQPNGHLFAANAAVTIVLLASFAGILALRPFIIEFAAQPIAAFVDSLSEPVPLDAPKVERSRLQQEVGPLVQCTVPADVILPPGVTALCQYKWMAGLGLQAGLMERENTLVYTCDASGCHGQIQAVITLYVEPQSVERAVQILRERGFSRRTIKDCLSGKSYSKEFEHLYIECGKVGLDGTEVVLTPTGPYRPDFGL